MKISHTGLLTSFRGVAQFMVLPGLRFKWSDPLVVDSLPGNREEFVAMLPRRNRIDLILGSGMSLEKTHELPSRARKQSSSILALRANALGDAAGAEVLSAAVRLDKRDGKDRYRQILIRRTDLDQICSLLRSQDKSIRTVSVASESTTIGLIDNRSQVDRPIWLWWIGFMTLIAAILGVAVFLTGLMVDRRTQALDSATLRLQQAQSALDQLSDREKSALEVEANLADRVARLERGTQSVVMLSELSSALDDSTWINEFSLDVSEVRLSGSTTSDIGQILKAIESLDLLSGVGLDQPVILDRRTGRSSFAISATFDTNKGRP